MSSLPKKTIIWFHIIMLVQFNNCGIILNYRIIYTKRDYRMESAIQSTRKKLLNSHELINLMSDKGVTFNTISKLDAEKFLAEKNN